MTTASIFPVVLLFATLLCTLVAGFILLFAIVVMPGIGSLQDREFLHAFQVIDRVIQKNQPVFLFVWMGSALALFATAILSVWQLEGTSRALVIVATVVYFVGVQLPTVTVNIPLNNRLQTLDLKAADVESEDLDKADIASYATERQLFEARWNRWNLIRTTFACFVSVLLLIVMLSFNQQ